MTLKLEDIDPNEDIRMKGADLIGYLVEARVDELMDVPRNTSVRRKDSKAADVKERLTELSGLVPTNPGTSTDTSKKPTPAKADDILNKLEMKASNYGLTNAATPESALAEAKQQLADGLVALAQQFNEYDPETQSDDPVEAVPVAAIREYFK